MTQSNPIIDWALIIFDSRFMASIDAMAAKRFVQPVLAEEATTAIIEGLSANNWQRLTGFGGKSQPSTYAYTVASRVMEDFARKKFGRPRPPQWLQEMGQVWITLWRMLCLERQWPQMIVQKLAGDYQQGLLDDIMQTIKQRIPRCGEPGFSQCCTTELGLDELPDDNGQSLNASMEHAQTQHALALLGDLMAQGSASDNNDTTQNREAKSQLWPSNANDALLQLQQQLQLSEDDKLLLSLNYEDGLSSRKIADLLNTSAATVQRRLHHVREQLAQALTEMGLTELPALEDEA